MRQFGSVRAWLMASVSTSLLIGGGTACAQAQGTNVQALPPVEVAPPSDSARRSRSRSPERTARPRAVYVPVAPTSTSSNSPSEMEADKVPASVNVIDSNDIARTDSFSVTDALQQRIPGISINEVAGNPFQPDIQFRGFNASPVAGTPQGLAVYQNGVRINEAFGDTVNWDLIPTAAIRSVSVVTNNPAFGLNALGGAIDVQMKDGFSYQGAELNLMGGSFGRIQGSAQWGQRYGDYAVYGALEGLHDNGFRNFSASDIRRFYGDVGYRNGFNEFHLNMGVADNKFGAAATVPVELLQQYWGSTYTTPQTSSNKVGYLNLTGKVEVTPSWTLEGNSSLRFFKQKTQDGNPTGAQPCEDDAGTLCFGDDDTPAFGTNGLPLANPFAPGAVLGENDRTSTRSTTGGLSLQATNDDQIFGHNNRFVAGVAYNRSVSQFNASAELGTIGTNYVLSGSGIYLGQSGDPISIGPVSLKTTNQYSGIYALDTFDVTNAFSVTGGGRFNSAQIKLEDQIGTALNGNHQFDRFNPIIGATYKITPELTAYAGYSEANRAPTPLELGCADPANPCIIGAFLISDPPLKQVVSRTLEAGLRGTKELNLGTLSWKVGGFRTRNDDDILPIPSELTGFGYFKNVGATRRQGIEAEVELKSRTFQVFANYTFLDARFLDTLRLGSASPSAAPEGEEFEGTILVSPGNQIPALPRHRIKAGFDYWFTDAFKVGADAVWVSNQYYAGDESNQQPKLPGYAVFNARASYQVTKNFQLYGRIDNLLDQRYLTYGTFFDRGDLPNFANGGAEFTDPRSVSPARPRAFYAGMRVTF